MWESFFETLRNCGKSAPLFVFLVFLIGAFTPLWGIGGWAILPILLVFCLARVVRFTRQHLARGRLGKLPPLSQNEKEVARSKLLKLRMQR